MVEPTRYTRDKCTVWGGEDSGQRLSVDHEVTRAGRSILTASMRKDHNKVQTKVERGREQKKRCGKNL